MAVIPRTMLCGGLGIVSSILYYLGVPLHLPLLDSVLTSVVLGLLLVFRTNKAYDRFWEGRKRWGDILNNGRNLASHIWVAIKEESAGDRQAKEAVLRSIAAFAFTTKAHLRREAFDGILKKLLLKSQYQKLQISSNAPLEISLWIRDYLQQQYERGCLNTYQLTAMFGLLDVMIESFGACERIQKTPVPLVCAIPLKQLLFIYCLSLSFQLVDLLQWATGLVVALISFAVFAVEEIDIEIENPFGHDPNDLSLDTICLTLQHDIEDLMTIEPSRAFQHKLSLN